MKRLGQLPLMNFDSPSIRRAALAEKALAILEKVDAQNHASRMLRHHQPTASTPITHIGSEVDGAIHEIGDDSSSGGVHSGGNGLQNEKQRRLCLFYDWLRASGWMRKQAAKLGLRGSRKQKFSIPGLGVFHVHLLVREGRHFATLSEVVV